MSIHVSALSSPRPERKTFHANQTTYRLEPWGETSAQLPIILMRAKKQRNSVVGSKEKIKITAFYSNDNSKQKQIILNRDASINSFSHGKQKKFSKYDSNIYRTKTIRNFDLMQADSMKQKLKKKLSKKLVVKKEKVLPEICPSSFSTHQQRIVTKVQKRLQLQRKIFMIMSRDRL